MSRRLSKRNYTREEFLLELDEFINETLELIEAECPAFAPGETAKKARIERALTDYGFFVNTYFPHYIKPDTEPSEFHTFAFKRIDELMPSPKGCKEAWAAPRGEAKSTLVTNMLPIWTAIRDHYLFKGKSKIKFVAIIMDSGEQAQTMLAAIKSEFESNARLKGDFPKVCGAGRVWNVGVILTANGIKMQAFGSGKKIRGVRHGPYRPGLVILDDIENDENVESKEQRDKTHKWVKKSVLNVGPPDGSIKVFSINTILHYDSVANRFQSDVTWKSAKFSAIMNFPDRTDLWDEWERLYLNEGEDVADAFYYFNKATMDQGSKVSWPSMRPLLALMKLRAADHHSFDCEYQNNPSSDEFAPFSNLDYYIQVCRDWMFFGAHDPSLGKNNKKNDPSASLVGGYDREHGVLDVVEARIARIKPHMQIIQLIELQEAYNCLVWAMETVQFQEFFAEIAVEKSAAQHTHLPIQPVVPHTDKTLRILKLQPHVNNKLIRSHRNHHTLNEQLLHFGDAAHDDGPDALEMLWEVARSFTRMLGAIKTGRVKINEKYNCGQ